jgi:hypothetical protein
MEAPVAEALKRAAYNAEAAAGAGFLTLGGRGSLWAPPFQPPLTGKIMESFPQFVLSIAASLALALLLIFCGASALQTWASLQHHRAQQGAVPAAADFAIAEPPSRVPSYWFGRN